MSKLIDAEKLDFVSYQGIPDGYKDSFDSGVLYAMNLIDEQPTVDDVPVVHGHWIKADLDHHYINHNYVTCSNCKELNRDDRLAFIPDYAKGMHYCMICGAKMDAPTQSNDSNVLDALGNEAEERTWNRFTGDVKSIPSVDAVPVVHGHLIDMDSTCECWEGEEVNE